MYMILGKTELKDLFIISFFKTLFLAILFDCLMNSLLTELYKYKISFFLPENLSIENFEVLLTVRIFE